MAKDYYNTLGIERNATKDEIKKAFRGLAHKYHPDKLGGDEAKFKEINEAYQVLSDDRKREEYNTYGQAGAGGGGGPFGGGFSGGVNFNGVDLGDIFGDLFGGGGAQQQARRGRDISVDIQITFKDSVFGVEKKVSINKTSVCNGCKGSGARRGTTMSMCKVCNGQGRVQEARRSMFGTFASVVTCRACSGKGEKPKEVCKTCRGEGVYKQQQELTVQIPAGINNGEMIRLTGAGEAVAHGVRGDLYIKIHVPTDPVFRRSGADLVMNLDIKLTDALLGATHTIKTLDGDIELKIPKGVAIGEVLRIKGKGIALYNKKRGDLLVSLNIKMPRKLSSKIAKIVEELKDSGL